MKTFFDNIGKFAFFPMLNNACVRLYGKSALTLMDEKRYEDVARALVEKEGLNYGKLPKALLQFHKIIGDSRTSLEEHLAEGAQYAADKDGLVRVHFTVSEDHLPLVKLKVEEAAKVLALFYGVKYDISYSV